ncbi:hypothetical protein [Dyadobacter crusticola]|uniref:hypothetical protein n=1 Tax=Dyadobacter crusticola TaxID=292407 RepID=UPI0004E1BA38|nr:hypothetical protein [Dyadobacter crusticola]
MKKHLIHCCALLFLLLFAADAEAQKARKDDSFPTYEQIRGNRREIYDYVAPVQVSNRNDIHEIGPPTVRLISRHYNAFSYPADSTIYFLNGRKIKNQKTAEAELRQKAGNVERVMIGAVDEKGMRVIEIDYEPKKVD